jgi:hypothetical protein
MDCKQAHPEQHGDREMRFERERQTQPQACDRNRPCRRSLAIYPRRKNSQRRQQLHGCDVLALAESLSRQNRQYRRGKYQEPPTLNPSKHRRRVHEERGHDRERDRDSNKGQPVYDDFRGQTQCSCDQNGRNINQHRHRRIGLKDIGIETLPVQYALAADQQPADVGVGSNHMPQGHRHREQGGDDKSG